MKTKSVKSAKSKLFNCLLGFAFAFVAIISPASAQTTNTIYSDPLIGTAPADGSGFDNINGTTPAITTGGNKWLANSYGPDLTVTGLSAVRNATTFIDTAVLPLTLDGVGTYTLAVNAIQAYTSGDMFFGFMDTAGTTTFNRATSPAGIRFLGYGGGLKDYSLSTTTLAIYYGCADTVTGLAFTRVGELIDFIKDNSEL